jgi:hypothetical protein
MGTACATSIHLGEHLDRMAAEDEASEYFDKVHVDLAAERLKSYEETDGKEFVSDLGELSWTFDPEFQKGDDAWSRLQQAFSLAAIASHLPAGEDRDQADKAAGAALRMAAEALASELSETEAERFIKSEEREMRDPF